MNFNQWHEANSETIIDLFCAFIKEEKVYDITLDQFTRHLYTETDTECPHCKEEAKS